MFELDVQGLVLGALSMGVAAAILAIACVDDPPPGHQRSRRVSLTAGVVAVALLAGGILALVHLQLGRFGCLCAGAELAAAGAVWTARGSRRRDDDDGGGGG